jgi:hypothetical protein
MRDDGAVNNSSNQASEAGIDSGAFRSLGETTLRQRSSSRYHQRQLPRAVSSGHSHHGWRVGNTRPGRPGPPSSGGSQPTSRATGPPRRAHRRLYERFCYVVVLLPWPPRTHPGPVPALPGISRPLGYRDLPGSSGHHT